MSDSEVAGYLDKELPLDGRRSSSPIMVTQRLGVPPTDSLAAKPEFFFASANCVTDVTWSILRNTDRIDHPIVLLDPRPMRVSGRSGRAGVVLAVAFGVGVAGCGSTATIAHPHGLIEAEIVQSDSGGISVRQRSDEPPLRVNRGEILGIDHPGNVAMVIGACLLAGWGSFMTDRQFRDELFHGEAGDVSRGARPLTLLLGVPGAIFLGLGSYHYISSVRAAWAFQHPEPRPAQAPPAGGSP